MNIKLILDVIVDVLIFMLIQKIIQLCNVVQHVDIIQQIQ